MHRWLVRIGIGVVVLVAVLIVTAKLLLRTGFAADKVAAQLQEAAGAPVHVGSLDVGITGSNIQNVQFLEDGAPPGQPPWAEIAEVDADASLPQLIRGDFASGDVTLHHPKLIFRFDRDDKLLTKLPSFAGPSRVWPVFHIVDGQITFQREGSPDAVFTAIGGTLQKTGDHIVLKGAANDPVWGDWTLAGDRADAATPFKLTLHTDAVRATPQKLRRVPFVPPVTWEEVSLDGTTLVDLALQFGGSQNGPAVHYRVALAPTDTTVYVSSIDLTAHGASGKVLVEDGLVTLTDVNGNTAGGTLHLPKSVLDFRGDGSKQQYSVSGERLKLRELPKKWGLPAWDGRLSGRADITVTTRNEQVQTKGGGSGVIEGFLSQKIEVKLTANDRGFKFDISNAPSAAAPEGRHNLAQGVSPGYASRSDGRSPNGAALCRPAGAPWLFASGHPGLAPWAKLYRPFGAKTGGEFHNEAEYYFPATIERLLGIALVAVQPTAPAPAPPPPTAKTIRINLSLTDVSVAELVQKFKLNLPVHPDGRVTFHIEATIPFSDPKDLKAYQATGTFEMPWARFGDFWLQQVKSQVTLKDGVLRLDGLTARAPNPPPAAPPAQLLPGGTIDGAVSADIAGEGELSANVRIAALPVGLLLKSLSNGDANGAGTADGEIQFRTNALRDPSKWTGGGRLVGHGLRAFGRSADEVDLQANIAAGVLHVSDARVKLENTALTGTGQATLSGKYPFEAHIELPPSNLAALQRLAPEVQSVRLGGQGRFSADAHGGLKPFDLQANGAAHVEGFAVDDFRVGNIDCRWAADPDRLTLNNFAATLYGGQLAGTATLPFKPAVAGKVDLTLNKVDTANLTKDMPRTPVRLEGQAQGSVAIDLPPAKPNGEREITGDINLQADKLRVENIPADRLKANVVYRSGIADYKITGETLGGTFDLSGRYPDGPPTRSGEQGLVRIHHIDLAQLASALRIEALKPLAGQFDLDAAVTSVNEPKGSGQLVLTGLAWGGKPVTDRLSGAVHMGGGAIRINELGGALAEGAVRIGINYDLRRPGQSTASLRAERVDAHSLLAPFTEKPPLDGPLDIRLFTRFGPEWTGTGQVLMGYGKLAGIIVRDAHFPLGWDVAPGHRGELRLHDAGAQASRGRLTGQGNLSWGEAVRLDGQILFNAVDIAELLSHYSQTKVVSGLASGRVDLGGRDMHSAADLTARVNARLAQASPGQMPVFQQIMPMILPGVGSNVQFQSGDLDGQLSRGVFRIQRLTLVGQMARIHAEGTVTLQQRLSLNVVANTKQLGIDPAALQLVGMTLPAVGPIPLGALNQAVSYLSNQTISLRVTGTVKAPSVQVNPIPFLTESAVRFFIAQAGVPVPSAALQAPGP